MNKCAHRAMSAKSIREAERHLSQSDEVMARLVSAYGACPLAEREPYPFHTLVRAIIGQQLSAKAAATIAERISQHIPAPFTPDGFLSVPIDTYRSSGLSTRKSRYISELATRVKDGRISFDDLKHTPDESVITALTALPGIGRWTAEMFLVFGLNRPDVLSLGDVGLQRAAKMLYGDSEENGVLQRVSDAWRPYRSVASWYLWEYLDAAPTRKTH